MSSTIRIKRSATSGNPSSLAAGELAYSGLTDNGTNGGDRLYIGFGTETNGNAANHFVIGGKYFTDKLDHAPGALVADSAIIVDNNKKIDEFFVDNLEFNGNTISSTDFNGEINIVPNGTGDVFVTADTTIFGDPNNPAAITTNGVGNLTLSTNSGINSGTINIEQGTDGDISITPDGSGEVNITNINIDGGSIGTTTPISEIDVDNLKLDGNSIVSTNTDGVVRIAPNGFGDFQVESDKFRLGSQDENVVFTTFGAGDLTISTNNGSDSGTILIPAGENENITINPDGVGNVVLSADTTVVGDLDTLAKITTQGTGTLVIDTNDGVNTGTITLNQGVDGNIVIEPNGTGRTIAHNLFVDDGSTERSIQEFIEDISGGQIQGTTDVINVSYNDSAGTTTIDLFETGVTTGSYGSQTKIPTFTVDADGRLTDASEVDVATELSISSDSGTSTVDLLNDLLAFTGGTSVSTDITTSTVGETTTHTLNVDVENASTTVKGIASFDSSNFDVSSGAVSSKDITLGSSTLTLGSTTSTIDGLNQIDVDNIRINGNTIFSTDTDGDIILSPDSSTQTAPGSVNVDDSRIINLNNPIDPKDAANKRYVDDVAQGLQALPAADLATTANLDATYDNGTNGVGATLTSNTNGAFPTIDGIQLELNENILVKNQTNLIENGSYVLTQVGDASNPWVLERCFFCDEVDEIRGAFEFVTQGSQFGNTGFVATVPIDFVIGSTDPTSDTNGFTNRGDIVWVQFSGSGTFTAGTNLNLDGTEFNLNDDIAITDLESSTAEFTSLDALVLDTGNNVVSAPFKVSGGAAFESDTVIEGIAMFTNTSDSVSLDTGAVVVDGGAAINKTVYVGDDLVGSGVATSEIDRFTIDGGTY